LTSTSDIPQINLIERGDQEFPYFPPVSHLKPTKINYQTYALIFVQKTIPPIYMNGGSKTVAGHIRE
jgi:hypothetical protein